MSANDQITTTCPNCEKSFEVSASNLGNKGRCDQCQTKFIIHESTPKQPSPAPKSTPPSKKSSSNSQLTVALILACAIGGYIAYTKTIPTEKSSTSAPQTQPTPTEIPDSKPTPQGKSITKVEQTTPTKPPIKPQPQVAQKSSTFTPFPVKTQFSKIDIGQYFKTYPDVHQGWMPDTADKADEAKTWGNHYGPLGIRTRSHAPQLQARAAFAANVPRSIQNHQGGLGLTASEVIAIAPGSPAENHLQIGDLIIGIEGEMLQSGNQYRPDWKFMHKDARELQLMFGEKIDQAQDRGDIKLSVLRYAADSKPHLSRDLKFADGTIATQKIPVNSGDEIQLIVDPKSNNESDHLAWINPTLTGKKGTLNLADTSKINPTQASTGWGKVTYGKDLDGNDLGANSIAVHAPSTLTFTVPQGYDTFETSLKVTKNEANLNVKINIASQPQPLPITQKELWAGIGGNQSVPPQTFDVEIPTDGYITLESGQFDDNIHGDGTAWLNVTIEGEYGTKNLFERTPESMTAGYGRPELSTDKPFTFKEITYNQSLNLHAHGTAKWKIPAGTKRIKGTFAAISYGAVQPKIYITNLALPLTGIHKDKVVELQFPIGKTGSFSNTYPKDCPKTDLTVQRQTNWLAAQQLENGSWSRLRGYTGDGWDTAWCALALMSNGEAKYNEPVRKAAYYLAYENAPSEWTAERAMRLILLSEYYLRTQDEKIIPGIQAAYFQLLDCCKTDNMAGHKVNGFGYGIAGQHYGTGHLALAMALASRTPITIDTNKVNAIIQHAGVVCVNGTYAYGRGRRQARDNSRSHSGGNAMSGPAVLGIQIGGGHTSSVKEHTERIEASIGDGDNSHATSTLAFIFSSLAIAAADEDVFLKHMQNFKYKMTIDDNWEGGFLKSAFPLDFQGGESVTSSWIRSAGSILVLNALKHKLAITGKKELWNQQPITTTPPSEWGTQIHSYYLRNWCLAKELLGNKAPRQLDQSIRLLNALPRTIQLVPETQALVTKFAPQLIKLIANNRSLNPTQRAYAIELICGLDFKIYTKKSDNNQTVELEINQPFHQLNWLDQDKAQAFNQSPLPLQTKVEINSPNLTENILFETNTTEGFNLDLGTKKLSTTKPLKKPTLENFEGSAKITFKIGETSINYTRPLKFNTEFSHSSNYNLRRLKLKLKVAPRAYFQSQPLIIAGIPFDCMYPAERMLNVTYPTKETAINIHEGDEVIVDLASENFICPWVHTMEFKKDTQVTALKPQSITPIIGKIEGNSDNLLDLNQQTECNFIGQNSKTILEYDFGQEVTANGLDANYAGNTFMRIWVKKQDTWIPLVWDNYSVSTGQHPTFPDTKARLWRIEIQPGARKTFQSLRLYHNPHTFAPRKPLPQQTSKTVIPAILPQ